MARRSAVLDRVVRRAVTTVGGRRAHQRQLKQLETAPWGSAEAMDRLRLQRLQRTVARAAAGSPFYRALLDGEAPAIASFDDLAAIPVTAKTDMTASGLDRALPGSSVRPRTTWRTSGSSGQPFVFDVDLTYGARHDAQRAFIYKQAGLPVGAPIVEILGFGGHLMRPPQVSYPTFRRTVIGYGRPKLAEAVLDAAPRLLYGNRSHLLAIADDVDAIGRRPPLRLVCSSSETLHPDHRERLSSTFGAPVLEVYGSAEASNLAFRLPGQEGWTTLEPRVVVEVLDDDRNPAGPGELGEIVVTTLTEPTSPLLRYATGDLARVSAGSGRGSSGLRLGALEGRSADAVVAADGRRVGFWDIGYAAFWAADDVARHVHRWQVHQHADRSITVSLELTASGDAQAVTPAIEKHLRSRLGSLPVEVVPTDRIHDPTAGKFRAVTSAATPAT
jgi:phenylacetate-CoA ligase